jgi:hypothetical protein
LVKNSIGNLYHYHLHRTAMKTTIKIKYESWKRMGVPRKEGGSGIHKDRRTKRQRTRQAQKTKWVDD